MTESDPKAVISRAEIPQRSSLLPCRARAIPFCRKHGRYRAVKRRAFITLLGGAAVALPFPARAQQPGMALVGLLSCNQLDQRLFGAYRPGLQDAACCSIHHVA